MALLALLAAAGPPGLSRDKVIAYLWLENDEASARNTLKQDETVAPYPTAPNVNQLNPIMQAIGADVQTGFAGPVEYGAGADGLASAASVESLAEIGR